MFKTKINNLLKDDFLKFLRFSTILNALNFIIFFVSSIYFTRLLGPELRGQYYIISITNEFLSLLAGIGLSTYITDSISKKISNHNTIINSSILIVFITSIISTAIFTVLNVKFNFIEFNNLNLTVVYSSILLGVILINIDAILVGSILGTDSYKKLQLVTANNAIILLITYFVLYSYNIKIDLKNILLILYLSIFLKILLEYFILRKNLDFKLSIRAINLKTTLLNSSKFTISGNASNIINFLNYKLDHILINNFINSRELGNYSLATNISNFITYLPNIISNYMVFYLNQSSKKRVLIFASFFIFIVTVLPALAISYFSEEIIRLLYGEEFIDAAKPLSILAFGAVFLSLTKIIAPLNIVNGNLNSNLIATIVGLAATVSFNLYLIPKYGMQGAAYSSTFAYISILLTVTFFIFKKYGFSKSSRFLR